MGSRAELVQLVGRILHSCCSLDQVDGISESLFRPNCRIQPIPFFGNLEHATVITVGVNPSSTEFEPWRNWGCERMAPQELTDRLLSYFHCERPRPHPWFAEIEQALNIIDCSYTINAAHLDLSPRATRSMRTFTQRDDKKAFIEMLRRDVKWLEELFSCCSQRRLVIFVGSVVDLQNAAGIGVGDFVRAHCSELWDNLAKHRWPRCPCSKSRLAQRIFAKQKELKQLIAQPAENAK